MRPNHRPRRLWASTRNIEQPNTGKDTAWAVSASPELCRVCQWPLTFNKAFQNGRKFVIRRAVFIDSGSGLCYHFALLPVIAKERAS